MLKQQLGQFFTRKDWWLNGKPQIIRFIRNNNKRHLVDPFAGEGHIIDTCHKVMPDFFTNVTKYDIDNNINANWNDSLVNIPYFKESILITNPPYLAKVSAKRKKIFESVEKYFNNSEWNDLYKIALEKMILSNMPGVAIVPESFMNSSFLKKYKFKIDIITIVIPNPFEDTEIPICVVCFNGNSNVTEIYKNNERIGLLSELDKLRLYPKKNIKIIFNDSQGQIGLRAIDSSLDKKIEFMPRENFHYNPNKIKISSRVMTYISIKNLDDNTENICQKANKILELHRENTNDIYLTPFKGNNNLGERRRRLDYKTARAILEEAVCLVEVIRN